MSTRLSAPRFSRSGDSGAFVSENGTEAASLICTPHVCRRNGGARNGHYLRWCLAGATIASTQSDHRSALFQLDLASTDPTAFPVSSVRAVRGMRTSSADGEGV